AQGRCRAVSLLANGKLPVLRQTAPMSAKTKNALQTVLHRMLLGM
ncbi:MAG: hypothetical protein AVDCRST_MAG93-9587, partial [uncultured Chloroflexia bacterium]